MTAITCTHGRPDHQELIQQLAEALHGERLPARPQTPESVWNELLSEVRRLVASNTTPPVTHSFLADVAEEAGYQRDHWGDEWDAGKSDADWFWTLGHIAGKALHDPTQTVTKQRHRLRAAAALLLNWDRQIARDSGSDEVAT